MRAIESQLGTLSGQWRRVLSDLGMLNYAYRQIDLLQKRKDEPDVLDSIHTMFDWVEIALRDAAMTIHDFKKAMFQIKNILDNVAALKAAMDYPLFLNTATQLYPKHFPDAKKTRNAAGHPVDIMNTKKRNQTKGTFKVEGYGTIRPTNMFVGNVYNQTMTTHIDGQMVSITLSSEAVTKLKEVLELIFQSFASCDPLNQHLRNMK